MMKKLDKITIKVSSIAYKQKPDTENAKVIFYDYLKDSSNHTLSYENIARLLENGHSVTLAEYEKGCNSIKEQYIKSLSCIALDIDGKDHKINMYEMVAIIYNKFKALPIIKYCTFSDVDSTRFRLIYRFDCKIDVEVYRTFYSALQWKLSKYLDRQTKNANRSWAGTNKKVEYTETEEPFSRTVMIKLINAYQAKILRDSKKAKIKLNGTFKEFSTDSYIKTEYKKLVTEFLIENIDLREFIPRHFNWKFKKLGDNLVGNCIFHGGDNPNALVVSKQIYTCFTNCGTGNIITVARKVYNMDHFSTVAFNLAKEYNLNIPKEYIKER